MLESPLSWENYTEKMQLLLYLEELQMEVDIKKYNIPNNDKEYATMVRDPVNKKLLVLEVTMSLYSSTSSHNQSILDLFTSSHLTFLGHFYNFKCSG